VLTGEPGTGKTTLWEAGLALAQQRGLRVLAARGSGAETQLSSAAVIDLLDGVRHDELASLPPPEKRPAWSLTVPPSAPETSSRAEPALGSYVPVSVTPGTSSAWARRSPVPTAMRPAA